MKHSLRAAAQFAIRQYAIRDNVQYGTGLHVGPGSVIWAPQHLVLGRDVYVGKHVTIEADGVIGDGVLFANGSGVIGRTDHDIRQVGAVISKAHWVGNYPRLSTPTEIGSDVWVGFNAIVQSGVRVGNSCIIAAGAVVTNDIPDNAIAVGVPAKVIRDRFTESDFEHHWEALGKQGVKWIQESGRKK